MALKICVADGQTRVRFGLRILLEQQPGWKVTGEVTDTKELLEKMNADCPDLVLLDWDLQGTPKQILLPNLRELHPGLLIVILSGRPEMQRVAMLAGADAFASKADSPEKLLNLIRDIACDKPC
ncbi:MAG: response regulator transcription factor [Chloroflexota bacterium]